MAIRRLMEGEVLEGIIVETFDEGRPWLRVRPLADGPLDLRLRVEFPKQPRGERPIGSRFRCTVKVCQKHNLDGTLRGGPYLYAYVESIVALVD